MNCLNFDENRISKMASRQPFYSYNSDILLIVSHIWNIGGYFYVPRGRWPIGHYASGLSVCPSHSECICDFHVQFDLDLEGHKNLKILRFFKHYAIDGYHFVLDISHRPMQIFTLSLTPIQTFSGCKVSISYNNMIFLFLVSIQLYILTIIVLLLKWA